MRVGVRQTILEKNAVSHHRETCVLHQEVETLPSKTSDEGFEAEK